MVLTKLIKILKSNTLAKSFFLKYVIKRDSKFPPVLWIESTNLCNLKCEFCPRERSSKNLGVMSLELYKKIIDESLKYGKRYLIGYSKDGDPLLNKDIFKMIEYTKKKNAARIINLTTNAVVLNNQSAKNLIELGIEDLRISLDAVDREGYKKIKGVDYFNQVEENINQIIKLKKESKSKKPSIRVKAIEFKDKKDTDLFIKKWKNKADWVEVTPLFQWGDLEIDNKNIKRYACPMPWYALAINWNGDVSLCCLDNGECILGNLKEKSLYEIWHSEKLKKIRKLHLSKRFDEIKACKNCTAWVTEPNIEKWLRKNG